MRSEGHNVPSSKNAWEVYDLLMDYASISSKVRRVVLGLVWTLVESEKTGLAMSPGVATRTLPWSGDLSEYPLSTLSGWLRDFDPYRATLGMAAVNAALNQLTTQPPGTVLQPIKDKGSNLIVFDHFLPLIRGKKIVVIGRYPGLDTFAKEEGLDLTILERIPQSTDLPDPAAEYVVPEADWVFLTSTTLPNKTFPRLAELALNAKTVLMGPTTPWLPDFYHFGIDYLAGVEIHDPEVLLRTVCEGGGVRIFDQGVRYKVLPLTLAASTDWAKALISETYSDRESRKTQMATWYADGQSARYPGWQDLEGIDRRLSRLDSCFKRLWDSKQLSL